MASIIYQANGQPVTRTLDEKAVHIGRANVCEIQLKDKSVSSLHAEVKHSDQGWTIADLKSRNHTSVNGKDIFGQPPVVLKHLDLIQICQFRLQYIDPNNDSGETSTISLIVQLKDGKQEAVEQIWQNYFNKLAAAAKRKLGHLPLRAFDEEDVALSVIDSLCRGAAAGNFTRLKDEHDLWNLLLAITRQKAIDRIRHQNCQKNNAGRTAGESVFHKASDGSMESASINSPASNRRPSSWRRWRNGSNNC